MIVKYCNQDPLKKNNHFKEGIITIAQEMGFDRSELILKSTEDICIELLYSDYAPSFSWFRKIKMTLTSTGRVKYLLKNIKMLLTQGLIYCSIMRPNYEPDIGSWNWIR